MTIKPIQIRNILKLLITPVKRGEPAVYNIDSSLIDMAKDKTERLMKRYETEKIEREWKPKQKETMFYGLLGEQLFRATLYQLKIDYQYTEPLYPHELRRPHDFEVSGKTIQVKTIQPTERYKNLVVKVSEWTKSDIVVAIKLLDKELNHAQIVGFLYGKEVEDQPIAENEYPCFYEPCYWISLSEVSKRHTAYELLFKIFKPDICYLNNALKKLEENED